MTKAYNENIMAPSLDAKTTDLLKYLAAQHPNPSITVLMKLCYLIDLISFQNTATQITNFVYKRYTFGPFDQSIYPYLEAIVKSGDMVLETAYSRSGDEYVLYRVKDKDFVTTHLSKEEISLVDDVVDHVSAYGAKALTEIAYKTKPMEALHATLGGTESLGSVLDLSAK